MVWVRKVYNIVLTVTGNFMSVCMAIWSEIPVYVHTTFCLYDATKFNPIEVWIAI